MNMKYQIALSTKQTLKTGWCHGDCSEGHLKQLIEEKPTLERQVRSV